MNQAPHRADQALRPTADNAPKRRASYRGAVQLLAVAVISAVVASASTVGVLGAFSIIRPAVGSPAAPSSATSQPGVQLAANTDTAPDLTDVVARATQSVVTITSQGMSRSRFSPFGVPSTGVGSGVVVTCRRADTDQQPRR